MQGCFSRAVRAAGVLVLLYVWTQPVFAQQALTWDQAKTRFQANNPALKADADNVDEMRAQEITAFLRPNPSR